MKTKLLLLLLLANFSIYAQTTAIPDINFEKELIRRGIDSGPVDGQVLTSKISGLISLDVSDSSISDLTGIQAFKDLEILNCSSNLLTSLDVSQNRYLSTLNCSRNAITALNLSQNSDLSYLTSSYNKLTTLSLTSNPKLKRVQTDNNLLTSLVVSSATLLNELNCDKNSLSALDLNANTALKLLSFTQNKITAIDLSQNVLLTDITCWQNKLTALDVSRNTKLVSLYCEDNKIAKLDLSKNTDLVDFACSNNSLTELNLKNGNNTKINKNQLNLTSNPGLTCIKVDNPSYSNSTWIAFSKDSGATYNTECESYTLIPDPNFEQKLIDAGIDSGVIDGRVLTSKAAAATSLYITRSSISDLTGIEDFTALTSLNCATNNLTSVNLSKNTKLTSLTIGSNKLTNLDVSNNVLLEDLDCQNNKLSSLNVSKNTLLTYLNASKNEITSLDVSLNTVLNHLTVNTNKLTSLNVDKNLALNSINCGGNQLTSLNVDKNLALKSLWCGSNKLTGLNIDKNLDLSDLNCGNNQIMALNVNNNTKLVYLICHYNKITSLNVSSNILLDQLMCHYNELTSLDVSNNPQLTILDCLYNKITSLDISKNPKIYEVACEYNNLSYLNLKNGNNSNFDLNFSNFVGNPNLTCILVDDVAYANSKWANKKDATATYNVDCSVYTLIPDVNFENALIAKGLDSGTPDGKVLTSNISSVTTIDLYFSNINDLTGIQDFRALKSLSCMSNKLSTIDLSKNIALTYLNAGYNNLTSLDLSTNINLENLSISYNSLTTLDVSKNINLEYFVCSSNSISDLNLSKNIKLSLFWCKSNKLSSLDLSKNVALSSLICSDNKLLTNVNLKNGNNLSITSNIYSIDFTENPVLSCIIVDSALRANEKWSAFKDPTSSYSSFDCSLVTAIPDPAFEDKLIALQIDTDGKNGSVLNSSISNITSLNVSSSSIKDLTGIEGFTSLSSLNCSKNLITSLNLSKNKDLTLIDSSQNPSLQVLNLKNGNNINFSINSNFTSNPNLTCIEVDSSIYSETNWSSLKDVTASYTEDCNAYTLIPDSNFEEKLIALEIDKDGKNGKVKTESLKKVTTLNLESLDISDLTGIEDCINLLYLNCNYNKLSTINVSNNKLLRVLSLYDNKLTSLNVTSNPEMFNLTFGKNQVSTIDLSQNTKLHSLTADSNLLSSIDFSANPDLESIYCGQNNLTTLNVSNLSNLKQLNCIYTNISKLDVRSNPKLENLYFNDAKLTSLDLSKNPLLKRVNLSRNELTTLDLSQNPLLELIFIEFNPITTLNVQNGNNKNFILPSTSGKKESNPDVTSFLRNLKLSCIQVDDVAFSNAKWSHIKESATSYSSKCTLGTEDSVLNKAVVYPTQTKGEVYINNISLEKATVYNSLGQLVKSFTLSASNTENTINLYGLPKGIYYVYLINGNAASAKKIIVE